MKKLLLRSAVFSTLLTFLCGAISHSYMPRVEAMAAPAPDMDPHMSMSKLRPLQPGEKGCGALPRLSRSGGRWLHNLYAGPASERLPFRP
jgi:hypothetical protein